MMRVNTVWWRRKILTINDHMIHKFIRNQTHERKNIHGSVRMPTSIEREDANSSSSVLRLESHIHQNIYHAWYKNHTTLEPNYC